METKKTTNEAYALKSLVLREGIPIVKEQLGVYVKKLKEGVVHSVVNGSCNHFCRIQSRYGSASTKLVQ